MGLSPFHIRTLDDELWHDERGDNQERTVQQSLIPFVSRGEKVGVDSVPDTYQKGQSTTREDGRDTAIAGGCTIAGGSVGRGVGGRRLDKLD